MDKSDKVPLERGRSKKGEEEVVFKESPLENTNQDWPYEKIIPLSSNDACPIVFDTNIHRSLTPSSLKAPKASKVTAHLTESLPQPLIHPSSFSHLLNTNSPNNDSTALLYDNEGMEKDTEDGLGGREAVAMLLMKGREAEYTKLYNYSIFCASWNVNDQSMIQHLNKWLSPPEDQEAPDIYAIGLQEVDLSKNSYLFAGSAREEEWLVNIRQALHPKNEYKMLQRCRLVGMLLVVYVKASIVRHIRDLQSESVGTGLFGMMGNKGGVSVRFMLRETSVCFVSCHLAAHTEELERRNQDFRDINSRLCFRVHDKITSISDHDVVFWMGDLNYRISDIDTDKVKKLLSINAFQDLLNFDQLNRQRVNKVVFQDYNEGAITFRPTYKFEPGTDNWDSGESARTPAWCDRILWKGQNVKQLLYRSHPQLKLSDHKPVSATFTMGTKLFDRVLERQVRESVMKLLDQKENEFLPQVSLSSLEVNFQDLKYLDNQQKTITVVNIGQVPVKFSFSNKPSENTPCKPWLNIQPSHGFVHVGAKIELLFEVQINSKTVKDWQSYQIEDIVVLHLEGGKDFFITISANCLPSFFGLPLSKLVQIHSPIALNNNPAHDAADLGVPKELWFIVDYLFRKGLKQEELFQILGLEKEIRLIRDKLDSTLKGLWATSTKAPQPHIHSVAETLLIFLDSLPEPVIPYTFYHACITCTDHASMRTIIGKLPTCHSNVFKYLSAFLNEYLSYSRYNNSDSKTLAHIFSGVLLKSPEAGLLNNPRLSEESRKRADFVEYFIAEAKRDFYLDH